MDTAADVLMGGGLLLVFSSIIYFATNQSLEAEEGGRVNSHRLIAGACGIGVLMLCVGITWRV